MKANIALLALAAAVNAAVSPPQAPELPPECTSFVKSLVKSLPKATGALSSAMAEQNIKNAGRCTIEAAATITDDLSSFLDHISSWASSESVAISAMQTMCPGFTMPVNEPAGSSCDKIVIQTPASEASD